MLSAATARNPSSARISRGPFSIGFKSVRRRERPTGEESAPITLFTDMPDKIAYSFVKTSPAPRYSTFHLTPGVASDAPDAGGNSEAAITGQRPPPLRPHPHALAPGSRVSWRAHRHGAAA